MALLAVGAFLLGFPVVGAASAQPGGGEAASARSTDVTIEGFDQIRVEHEVPGGSSVRSLALVEGEVSNIEVVDGMGNEVEHGVVSGSGGAAVTVFPSEGDVFVRYDLSDVMFKKHGVTWTWPFRHLASTTFHLPESVDVAFVNDRPVYFSGEKTFNCHGCEMILEFVPDESKTVERVSWGGREFDVEVWASTELDSFIFDQSAKSISYGFDDSERWVTLIIPLELLWSPYQAWLDDEKIFTHEFGIDEGRAGVSLKMEGAGTVSIVGTSVIPEFPVLVPLMAAGIGAAMLLQHVRVIRR